MINTNGANWIVKLLKLSSLLVTMTLGDIIRGFTTSIGIAAIGVPLLLGATNLYYHHNISYEDGVKEVYQKVDGIIGYTEVTVARSRKIDLIRYSLLNFRGYIDYDGDGRVDDVFIKGNPFLRKGHDKSFVRNKNFNEHRDIFLEADKDFAEQLERFGIKKNS